jgi:hypothetical protein
VGSRVIAGEDKKTGGFRPNFTLLSTCVGGQPKQYMQTWEKHTIKLQFSLSFYLQIYFYLPQLIFSSSS